MRDNRKQLKRNTIRAIRDGKATIVWIGLAFLLLNLLLSYLSLKVSGELESLTQMAQAMLDGSAEFSLAETSTGGNLLATALEIMLVMLSVGFSVACLATARRQGASVGNLFDGFACFWRALGVSILQYLILNAYTLLYFLPVSVLMLLGGSWPLLAPVVCLPLLLPAVKAYLSYHQAVFLLLDHPELSAFACLRVSRELMKGHKWELFKLYLSFLGWLALCVIPLAVIWVLPYMQVCFALYYDELVQQYKSKMDAAAQPSAPPEGE